MNTIDSFKEALASIVTGYIKNYKEGLTIRHWAVNSHALGVAGFENKDNIPLTEFVDMHIQEMLNLYEMQYIRDESDANNIVLFYIKATYRREKDINGNEITWKQVHFYDEGKPQMYEIQV